MILRLHLKEPYRQILWVLLFSTLFFSVVAIVQYVVVENQARKTALLELKNWTQEVKESISYIDHWDLPKYRQSDILVPNFYIFTENGVVIDVEGFIPELIPSPKFLIKLEPSKPKTLVTPVGENWRLLLKKIRDGSVVLGIPNPEHLEDTDKELFANAKKFNNLSIEQVSKRSFAREVNAIIEYSVLDANGNVTMQLGGIPSELDKISLSRIDSSSVQEIKIGGKDYLILVTAIADNSNKNVGRILVPLDISLQREALQVQERFNIAIAALSWAAVILLLSWYVVSNEKNKRKHQTSLEEGLKKGECQTIEFKETLEVDTKSGGASQVVLKSALKTVAAFLNSSGGTLFVGVSDNHEVRGLNRDFRLCKKNNADGFGQKLRDLLCSRFHPIPWGKVNIRFEPINRLIVCAIDAQPLPRPEVVHFDGEVYVREGNTTRKLEGPSLTKWLQERFHG